MSPVAAWILSSYLGELWVELRQSCSGGDGCEGDGNEDIEEHFIDDHFADSKEVIDDDKLVQ